MDVPNRQSTRQNGEGPRLPWPGPSQRAIICSGLERFAPCLNSFGEASACMAPFLNGQIPAQFIATQSKQFSVEFWGHMTRSIQKRVDCLNLPLIHGSNEIEGNLVYSWVKISNRYADRARRMRQSGRHRTTWASR